MAGLYHDEMAEVRTRGKPRLFVTFACNPSRPETEEAIPPNQEADIRPDISARVFRLTLDAILKDMGGNSVIGKVVARM